MIKVVIVEDDYRIAGIHEAFLNKITNIEVVGKALNGADAIEMIHRLKPNLVLLDVYMPDMLGTDVIKTLQKEDLLIDFIIISAAVEKDIVQETIHSGIFEYIIKPVKMNRFTQTIERYKEMKRQFLEKEEIDQHFLDQYFGRGEAQAIEMKETPKGIDPLTLKKVQEIIKKIKEGISAEEMGNRIGASRTTARRYLEYLITEGEIVAELEYGIVGRPERIYRKKV